MTSPVQTQLGKSVSENSKRKPGKTINAVSSPTNKGKKNLWSLSMSFQGNPTKEANTFKP